MSKVWTIWSANDDMETLLVGIATSEEKAYEMRGKLEEEFEDAFEYQVCCMETDKITINDTDIRFQSLNNDFNGGLIMDIEEMMIDYIMNNATQEEVEEFFGYAAYGVCTIEECENNLAQMPDEEFDMFVEKFGIPTDGIKL